MRKSVKKKLLQATSLDDYCSKSHIKCYNICLWCKKYFVTVGANGPNQTLFVVFFFKIILTSNSNSTKKARRRKFNCNHLRQVQDVSSKSPKRLPGFYQ